MTLNCPSTSGIANSRPYWWSPSGTALDPFVPLLRARGGHVTNA